MLINDRRMGHFKVHEKTIARDRGVVQHLMSRCIILRAEFSYSSQCFEYYAVSDLFDEVPKGQLIPHYEIVSRKKENGEIMTTAVKQ